MAVVHFMDCSKTIAVIFWLNKKHFFPQVLLCCVLYTDSFPKLCLKKNCNISLCLQYCDISYCDSYCIARFLPTHSPSIRSELEIGRYQVKWYWSICNVELDNMNTIRCYNIFQVNTLTLILQQYSRNDFLGFHKILAQ